jgi:hypothetical protein
LALRCAKETRFDGVDDSVQVYNNFRLGLCSGPLFGAGLNYLFGYSAPFFIMSIFFGFALIPAIYLLPTDDMGKPGQVKKKLEISTTSF